MPSIENVDILDEAKECFLTYSEEVLLDRAIPTAEDGLLSAQRKIIWTMEDYLKMDNNSKTKKCNALVGSTLATSYFHGDASCYGVLCKMSQEYLMRYPLIIGQGSLGTQENNDMVSSSRYTEAKPSIYADLMMQDYKKNVVPTKETYNGEYMEPVVLPSLFPNALCNGRQAIGISMAHSSPPHNLTEVCDAAIALLQNGDLNIDELMQYIKGPDFPLENTVMNSQDIREAFLTGKSKISLKVRGQYEIDGQKIIFTTIPYRTYRNKIREQIEKNVDALGEVIEDFDDESSVGQNRLIFHVKKGVSISVALDKLFNLTDLQTTVSYNMNFIVNGTPKLCSMIDLLKAYVNHQESVLIKATEYDKEKAEARAHVLRGLIAAVDKIDDVITLIKAAKDRSDARSKLINFLSIDEIQANAILDMKLGKLTKIDKQELVDELKKQEDIIMECNKILTDQEYRKYKLIEKITWLKEHYGDARRTHLLSIDIKKKEKEKVVVEPKDCVIIITKKGTIKRIDAKSFKPQRRNTVGIKTNGDINVFSQKTNTQDILMIFSSKGKMYRILVDNIPEGTNTSTGILLSNLVNFETNEIPIAYTTLARDNKNQYIFFATKRGIIKKVSMSEYDSAKRTGIASIKLKEGDSLAAITFINQEEMMLITKKGMSIRFATDVMPLSSRIAQGVKGMNVAEDDYVIAALPISKSDKYLAVVSEDGLGKKTELKEFSIQNRGGKGILCYKGKLSGVVLLDQDDNILISGNSSSIVVSEKDLPLLNRTSLGNVMIKNNKSIISISKV